MRLRILAIAIAFALISTSVEAVQSGGSDLIKQGRDALNVTNYDQAIQRFSEAIRLDPNNAEAWSERCEAYAYRGDAGRAITNCNEGIKLAPNDFATWGARCMAYAQNGKYQRAITDCDQAIRLAPNLAKSYQWRAWAYFYSGDYDRAMADYDKAVSIDPNDARTFVDRGAAYLKTGEPDKSIADCDEALRIDSKDSMAYALRGNAWLVKGNYDRAWDDLNRAIQADDKNVYAFVARGNYAAQFYDYKDAIVDFDRAILLDPNYKAAYRYRDEVIKGQKNIWWGKVYEVLFGVGLLATVYGAFRAYRSPTAFHHSIERHFQRLADGALIFYAPSRWTAYIVPESEKEQELRIFARRFHTLALAILLAIFVLMFAFLPATWQLLEVLRHSAGISTGSSLLVGSICVTSLIFTVLFVGVWLWRQASVRGLAKSEEKLLRPRANEWLTRIF